MADTDKKEEMYWKVNIYGEETDELILSTVQSRISFFLHGRLKKGQKLLAGYRKAVEAAHREELRRHEEWLGKLEEEAPRLVEVYKEYADWEVAHGSLEPEGIYLLGVHDGIHLMEGIRKL